MLQYAAVMFAGLFLLAFGQAYAEPREGQAGMATQLHGVEIPNVPGAYYGTVELRHHINTYYRQDGDRGRQTPSFHARAKVGATFRDNLIDAFATFGLIKGANTQQVLQRRPEFEVDIYPLISQYGQLVQYNVIQMPFAESAIERQESDIETPPTDGSIYTIGLAPTLVFPTQLAGTGIKLKAGADAWTQFFSRPQYREDERTPDERDHFGLNDEDGEAQASKEDVAQRYYTQYMLGTAIVPAFAPHWTIGVGMYYDVRYLPEYERAGEENQYKYVRKELSHYRGRVEVELSERASFINDFYHFHDGFFAAKRTGADRRFRNIARISYKL